MKSKNLRRPLFAAMILLLAVGLCMESSIAQEQICLKVEGPIFSISPDGGGDPTNGGWQCRREETKDLGIRWNYGMRDFVMNVNYFDGVEFENGPCVNYDPCSNYCFVDQVTGEDGIMTGTFQVGQRKNKPAGAGLFAHGYDILGPTNGVEILYIMKFTEGDAYGAIPPLPDNMTTILFPSWEIETEGRGKLKKQTCIGSGSFSPDQVILYIDRCPVNPDPADPDGDPLPCP